MQTVKLFFFFWVGGVTVHSHSVENRLKTTSNVEASTSNGFHRLVGQVYSHFYAAFSEIQTQQQHSLEPSPVNDHEFVR